MRVQHNIASMNSYRNYNVNTRAINKNLEKLSSGYKINRAGDDAAGLAISEKMRKEIVGLEGAQRNSKDGISLVQTAEGALTEIHSMLNRMYDLAEQSANGTYESVDRAGIQAEMNQLGAEITRIATSTKFNGISLCDNTNTITLQIGATADETLEMTASDNQASTLGVEELSIGTDDGGDARTAMGTIETAINTVSTNRSTWGAYQNRLEHTINNLAVTQENLQDAESTIRDTDVASEMMKYTKNSILVQSAQAMLAQANQQPQGVLQLLQ